MEGSPSSDGALLPNIVEIPCSCILNFTSCCFRIAQWMAKAYGYMGKRKETYKSEQVTFSHFLVLTYFASRRCVLNILETFFTRTLTLIPTVVCKKTISPVSPYYRGPLVANRQWLLQGQSNEIFDPQFCHHSSQLVPLTNGFKKNRFLLRFELYHRKNWLQVVS